MPSPKLSPPAALPEFISPELATLTDKAPAGDAWIHEIKLDGYRTAARLEAGKVRMLTRSGLDWTARFRPIATALALPKIRAAYLDGEIAVMGEDGVTSFAALQDALSRGQAQRLTYYVFDLLHLNGRDLTGLPLIERKALLAPLIARLPKGGPIRYSDHVQGQGPAFFAQACKHHLEGIVAKRAAAPYSSGRTEDWLKVKCLNRQEFVIGGWMRSDKPGRDCARCCSATTIAASWSSPERPGPASALPPAASLPSASARSSATRRPSSRCRGNTSAAPAGSTRAWWRR